MSIFDNINFRVLFKQAQPPRKRYNQILDLGEALLSTLKTDSLDLSAKELTIETRKKYSCVKMVFQAALNEIFGETTFVVETVNQADGITYFYNEDEEIPVSMYKEQEQRAIYLINESEVSTFLSAINIKVPPAIYTDNLEQVVSESENIKVAGKSINYESL